MEAQLTILANQYGGVDNLIQALQRLNLNQPQPQVQVQNNAEEVEVFVEIWRGDSAQKQVFSHLGRTNLNRYFLLAGSQISSEESDASTLRSQYQSITDILDDLRNINPARLDGAHILVHDFLVPRASLLKAWRVALGTTSGLDRWQRQNIHIRIGTPIQ